MDGGPAVRRQIENVQIEVEHIAFYRDVADDPHYAYDIEAHESGFSGIAVCEDRAERQSVAIEADQYQNCDLLVRA